MSFVTFFEKERMSLGKHSTSRECGKCFEGNNDIPLQLRVLLQITVNLSYLLFKISFRVILYDS